MSGTVDPTNSRMADMLARLNRKAVAVDLGTTPDADQVAPNRTQTEVAPSRFRHAGQATVPTAQPVGNGALHEEMFGTTLQPPPQPGVQPQHAGQWLPPAPTMPGGTRLNWHQAAAAAVYINPPSLDVGRPSSMEEVYVAARDLSDKMGNWLVQAQAKKDALKAAGRGMEAGMQRPSPENPNEPVPDEYKIIDTALGGTLQVLTALHDQAGQLGGEHAKQVQEFIQYKAADFYKVQTDFDQNRQIDDYQASARLQMEATSRNQTGQENLYSAMQQSNRQSFDRNNEIEEGRGRGFRGGGCQPFMNGGLPYNYQGGYQGGFPYNPAFPMPPQPTASQPQTVVRPAPPPIIFRQGS